RCFLVFDDPWTRKSGLPSDSILSCSRTPRYPTHQCTFRSDSCRLSRTSQGLKKARVFSRQETFVWLPAFRHRSESRETRTEWVARLLRGTPALCGLTPDQRHPAPQEPARRQTAIQRLSIRRLNIS